MLRARWTEASSTATPSTRPRRPITGPLRATRDPPIQTGFSSRQVAADHAARGRQVRRTAAAMLLGMLAIALGHDTGPRRFGIAPVGFDRLSGWAQDHISAAVPVFLKSCARFLSRADAAPLDAVATSVDFGRVGNWRAACEAAETLPPGDDAAARRFFQTGFTPFA